MLKRVKSFCRRHRILTALLAAILLPISLLLLYRASVITRAYLDTPGVIAQATSSDRLRVRLEDVPDDYQRILLTVEDPNFYSHHYSTARERYLKGPHLQRSSARLGGN